MSHYLPVPLGTTVDIYFHDDEDGEWDLLPKMPVAFLDVEKEFEPLVFCRSAYLSVIKGQVKKMGRIETMAQHVKCDERGSGVDTWSLEWPADKSE